MLKKIISGGQTGVDRAALDFALQNGYPCGGWCPKGRKAEDGPIDEKYPLTETGTFKYAVRTKLNVTDSDGTLILFDTEMGAGTKLTADYANNWGKPLLILNLNQAEACEELSHWLSANRIEVLNVAGPRESTNPGIHQKAKDFLARIFPEKA